MSDTTNILPDAEKLCKERFPGFLTCSNGAEDLKIEAGWLEAYGKDCLRAFCDEVEKRYLSRCEAGPPGPLPRMRLIIQELRGQLGI